MSKEKVYYEVESCENNCERVNELEQQNKYLTEQNKAFQEQYNTSGDIIRDLRQQNKELKALLCQRCNYFGACELDEIPCAVLNYK